MMIQQTVGVSLIYRVLVEKLLRHSIHTPLHVLLKQHEGAREREAAPLQIVL